MSHDIEKMYCGVINRGDIFLCEYEKKQLEAVVLQDGVLSSSLPTVVCALIKFIIPDEKIFPNEVLLKASETLLEKDYICQLHKIITVDRRAMQKKIGKVSEEKLQSIYKALDVNLGRFRDKN